MKTTGILVGLLVLAAAAFVGYAAPRGIPSYAAPRPAVAPIVATPARLAQGQKLLLASCADCHLSKQTNTLAGQRLTDVPAEFGTLYSANTTLDKQYGDSDGRRLHLHRPARRDLLRGLERAGPE